MSIRLMNIAWESEMSGNDKLVLLALADWANDDGYCWPSIPKLCFKTRASERTVQSIIKRLVDAGHVTRQERPGRGCMYLVHPRNSCTPADSAPPQVLPPTPAEVAGNTFKNHHRIPLTPFPAAERRSRKERVKAPPDEPVCTEVAGESVEAAEFRRQALEAIGDGAYRNLLQPCQAMRVGEHLLLLVPSETLRRVILDRQRELGQIAITTGFAGLRAQTLPVATQAPTHSHAASDGSFAGGPL